MNHHNNTTDHVSCIFKKRVFQLRKDEDTTRYLFFDVIIYLYFISGGLAFLYPLVRSEIDPPEAAINERVT